jgi:signal transduction histidine kinase
VNQRTANSPGAAFGWTLGHKLGLTFAVLAALLVAMGALVSVQLAKMHTSTERVLEEQREEALSREVSRNLQSFDEHLHVHGNEPLATDSPAREILRELLGDARESLGELERGPHGKDPSEEAHSEEEARLYAALGSGLDELRAQVDGVAAPAELAATLSRVRESAGVLYREMRAEASIARADMTRRGREMRTVVIWITLAALAILAGVIWQVERAIVRPIRELRDSAAQIGRGDLSRRVRVASRDEVGALADEFNHMAAELQNIHSDLEERVRQRTQEFVRAARLAGLGTLAAGVAHEINNPLASIASCAEGLERKLERGGASIEQQREYLAIIAKEAYRAHEITSRLLEFARTDPGERMPFALPDVLHEIDVLLGHQLEAHGVRLDVACDANLPEIDGNPSECKQVVLNLLQNALDATPRGGRIRVACKREHDEVLLEVEDQGPGVAAENFERIFDPFFTTKPPGKGTGLGLSIVARIVEGHGGRIEFQNTGHGAIFRVRLPASSGAAA